MGGRPVNDDVYAGPRTESWEDYLEGCDDDIPVERPTGHKPGADYRRRVWDELRDQWETQEAEVSAEIAADSADCAYGCQPDGQHFYDGAWWWCSHDEPFGAQVKYWRAELAKVQQLRATRIEQLSQPAAAPVNDDEERERAERERRDREREERERAERERADREREERERAEREQQATADCELCNADGHVMLGGDILVLPLKPTPALLKGAKVNGLDGAAKQCSHKISEWTTAHFVTELVCRHDRGKNFAEIHRFRDIADGPVPSREFFARCDAQAAEDAEEAEEYEQERRTCSQCDRMPGDGRNWIRDGDGSYLVVVFPAGRAPDKHDHLVHDGRIKLFTMPIGNPDNPTSVVEYAQVLCDHDPGRNADTIDEMVRDNGAVAVTSLTQLGAAGYGARGAITGQPGQSQLGAGLIPAPAAITTGDDTVIAEIIHDDGELEC